MTLNFSTVKSAAEFYRQLRKQADLEEFGDNLDALHDFLTTDLKGPAEIDWQGAAVAGADKAVQQIQMVIRSAAKERSDLKIRFS
jgi:RNAse (barnase) inhibitor barstar